MARKGEEWCSESSGGYVHKSRLDMVARGVGDWKGVARATPPGHGGVWGMFVSPPLKLRRTGITSIAVSSAIASMTVHRCYPYTRTSTSPLVPKQAGSIGTYTLHRR
jgi:hypothetical protein